MAVTHLGCCASAGLVLALTACPAEELPPTGVLVTIESEPAAWARATELVVAAFGGRVGFEERVGETRIDLARSCTPMPVVIGLEPRQGDSSRLWAIEARLLAADSRPRVVRRARGTFSRGRVAMLAITLTGSCVGRDCGPELTQSCVDGACVETPVFDGSLLADWDGALPPSYDELDGGSCDCDADVDCSGTVDANDLTYVDACTVFSGAPCLVGSRADVNCDGAVDGCDRAIGGCAFTGSTSCCETTICGACVSEAGAQCAYDEQAHCLDQVAGGNFLGSGTRCP